MLILGLARKMLTQDELDLAGRLYWLLESGLMKEAWALIRDIFPVYWRDGNGASYTLDPDPVYRSLYYLDDPYGYMQHTRSALALMGSHLEGLLEIIPGSPSSQSLGRMVYYLRSKGLLPANLAQELMEFNSVAYIRAKHLASDPFLPERLDIRTFSPWEAVLCLIMMRNFSIRLFQILESRGVNLPEKWKEFKREWLTWDRSDPNGWKAIAASEYYFRSDSSE